MHFSRILHILFWLLIALAMLKGFYHLVAQMWFFFEGAYAGDAMYYWTVGRGLLNGLELYADIFDTKPPIIYLFSALSFWFFNSGALGFWINALMVPAIPALFGFVAYRMKRDLSIVSLGVLFGTVITLYMATQAGAWQVEWYGGFFGMLYAFLLFEFQDKPLRYYVIGLLSLSVFLSVGFKEPFALSLLAVALLLLPDRRSMVRGFVVPVLIVAVVGVLALLLFGFFDGYFSVYLPSHFGHHLVRSAPLWQRGLWVDVLAGYLWQFSYVFPFLIAFLFGSEFLRSRSHKRWIIILVSLYLIVLAANIRGYPVNNHFVVAVPVYTALFLIFLQSTAIKSRTYIVVTALTAFTLIALPLSQGFPAYAKAIDGQRIQEAKNQQVAERIDAILDACDVDRYFFLEEKPYMPYTQHSPLNFFVYTGPESMVYHHPLLIEGQLESFSDARIVIAKGDAYEISQREGEKLISEMVFRFLAQHFTIAPWSCAASLPSPEGYSVLFRKDPNDTSPFLFRMKYEE